MAKVIKFPRNHNSKPENQFAAEYADFVDDLGGFLWHIRMISHKSFETLSGDLGLAPQTLRNIAERVTKNPQGRTIWCILRGLDNRQIIRHSMLEQYRPLTKKSMETLRAIEKKKEAKS